jgi:xanthine dehydrogenase molybdopterin binding subunit/xanthine dehydrogenase small subunit
MLSGLMSERAFEFVLNGERVQVTGEGTNGSLLGYLRKTGRTGTKEGCAEGDCGACTVALVDRDAQGAPVYRGINSCITLLPMLAGREVVTVEGLRAPAEGAEPGALHPVQSAMVHHYGSQCGYCTPGFIVSMFEGYYRKDLDPASGHAKVVDQLNGNLCRCTGYRPIRDAMMMALGDAARSKDDLFRLRLRKNDGAVPALDYETGTERFLRPGTLQELLALRAKFPEAELVAGATEIGVYINKRFSKYPLLISTEGVAELTTIRREAGQWSIGGGASLTALEEALGDELPMVHKMLWAFASRPIRNRATLAGNLVTASPIGDMPPVLLALDAQVVLASVAGERTVPLAEFFTGYRASVLRKDEVLLRVTFPHAPSGLRRLSQSYKVSKRRELDISIVAAVFVVDLDSANIVQSARLAYGGVAATPARARAAEDALVGQPWDEAALGRAKTALASAFTPLTDVRSGKTYREDLVVSLFEKFFRGEESEAQDSPMVFDCDARMEVTDASRDLSHESAALHVTGEAMYVDDVASRRGMLELWPVTSPHAHAKIRSIDISAAAAAPGVVTVLTAKDIPGDNDVGAVRKDESLLAEREVLFHGHIVAVVIAHTLGQARSAAAKITVDYAPEPAIIGIRQAMAAQSFHAGPNRIVRGDADKALAGSKHRLKGSLEIGGQEHFYLEAQAAWAEWTSDDGVFVCSSTQHPSEVQAVVSHVLHIPANRVVVQAPRMGGGFGGKETQGNTWAALVALAAQKTKRPVRVQLDRDLDMMLTGKRHPFLAEYEVGFDDDGHLTALRAELVSDGGWALDLSESILDRALFHIDNAYYLPAVHVTGHVAKTHTVSHTAFRGFGGPQGILVIEEAIDAVARTLGLPPETVRERNLYRGTGESNRTHYGQDVGDDRMHRIWRTLTERSELSARRQAIAEFNAKHEHVKRGIAITPVKFGISFTATWLNQAGALVLIYRDGTVQVNHGGTEMGQGLNTKMLGVTMRELGVQADSVRVMKTQTDKVPNTSATAASSGADLNGQAVKAACVTLRERLAEVAAGMLSEMAETTVSPSTVHFEAGQCWSTAHEAHKVAFRAVVERAYMKQVSLSAAGYYRTPGIAWNKAEGKGTPFYYFAWGAAVSEVEVDARSGMKRVRRVDIVHDVGTSLNPSVDRGQIEGAFVQGMGWLTGEELKWDDKGRLLSHSASTYQIPSIGDTPERFTVHLLENAAQEGVIHGSKAVGEPPLMLAISVREAIRDAVGAFGSKGPVALGCPATHEAIYASIKSIGSR